MCEEEEDKYINNQIRKKNDRGEGQNLDGDN
jgi:hypothetical protein